MYDDSIPYNQSAFSSNSPPVAVNSKIFWWPPKMPHCGHRVFPYLGVRRSCRCPDLGAIRKHIFVNHYNSSSHVYYFWVLTIDENPVATVHSRSGLEVDILTVACVPAEGYPGMEHTQVFISKGGRIAVALSTGPNGVPTLVEITSSSTWWRYQFNHTLSHTGYDG